MATAAIPPVGNFSTEGENVGERWVKWKKTFSYYAAAINVSTQPAKKALLLYVGGEDLQNIFEVLNIADYDNISYDQLVENFDRYFEPKRNVTYERHVFYAAAQKQGETNDHFITRLKRLALYCEFANADEQVRDKFIHSCLSMGLRRRLLQETNLTLEKLITFARTIEATEKQAQKMEENENPAREPERVNYMKKSQYHKQTEKSDWNDVLSCTRCGRKNHNAQNCRVAYNKKCHLCGRLGHFQKLCRSNNSSIQNSQQKPKRPHQNNWNSGKKQQTVQLLSTDSAPPNEEVDSHIFALGSCGLNTACIKVNDQDIEFIIDSGATVNVLSKDSWKKLNIQESLKDTNIRIFSYGVETPLELLGEVILQVEHNCKARQARFVVVNGNYPNLMGKRLSTELGLIYFPKIYTCGYSEGIEGILEKHSNIFTGIGKFKGYQVNLEMQENTIPKALPRRRIPYQLREKVENEIERLMQADLIERVDGPSPWLSPLVIVPKSNGGIRLCLNMQYANKTMVKHKFPIPFIEDMLEQIGDNDTFSELDFNEGFLQLELDDQSRSLTAFATETGVYRFKRMIYGLTVAPEVFQSVIESVLRDCPGARNYSDNILIGGKGLKEHNERLEMVLTKLEDLGFTLNKSKCKFAQRELQFLGYHISKGCVSLAQDKVESCVNMRVPENVTELKGFLGLVNFCSKFVPHIATLTEPLRRLTKKTAPWEWLEDQDRAFRSIKEAIAKRTKLSYFQKRKITVLMVDASPVGLGAILAQINDSGNYDPVAFASKSLTDCEKRYSQTEKEALAVVWGVERFNMYLQGSTFTILTDHKPLQILYAPNSSPSARIERWSLRLQNYDFKIKYIQGSENAADSLSRLLELGKHEDPDIDRLTEAFVNMIVREAVPKAMTEEMILEATRLDEELMTVIKAIQNDNLTDIPKAYRGVISELSIVKGIVLRANRIVIPKALQGKVLEIVHEPHMGIVKTKMLLRTKVWWPNIDKDVEEFISGCYKCQMVSRPSPPEPMGIITVSERPWQNLAIDICGPFDTGESLVVLVDYFSKWVEAKLFKQVTAGTITNWLEFVFTTHGYPDSISSDNGPQFQSGEYKDYLSSCGIKPRFVTPYWPQANGQVERLNRVVLKSFMTARLGGKSLHEALLIFLRSYRTTPHTTTGATPALLMMGRELRTKLPYSTPSKLTKVQKEAKSRMEQKNKESARYVNSKRKAKSGTISVNDIVLVKQRKPNKLSIPYSAHQFRVLKKTGNQLTLRSDLGKVIKRNVSLVKKLVERKGSLKEDVIRKSLDFDWLNYGNETEPTVQNLNANEDIDVRNIGNRPVRERKRPAWLEDYK